MTTLTFNRNKRNLVVRQVDSAYTNVGALVYNEFGTGTDIAVAADIVGQPVRAGKTAGTYALAKSTDVQGQVELPLDFTDMRVWNAIQTPAVTTAANDDLAVIQGTPGTDDITLQGADFGGTTATNIGMFIVELPEDYQAGSPLTVRATAGALTTVSDNALTMDVVVYQSEDDGTASADLCATAAQSINSLTMAEKDFVITAASLKPGDTLHVQVSITGTDTGNAGVMIGEIQTLDLVYVSEDGAGNNIAGIIVDGPLVSAVMTGDDATPPASADKYTIAVRGPMVLNRGELPTADAGGTNWEGSLYQAVETRLGIATIPAPSETDTQTT